MKIVLWSQPNCIGCVSAEKLLISRNLRYEKRVIGLNASKTEFSAATNGARAVPQIVVDDVLLGGLSELRAFLND